MQINGFSLSSVYSPKTNTESKDLTRLPVVIEARPITVENSEPNLLPVVAASSSYPSTTTVNDEQRSRFIRLLASALSDESQATERSDTKMLFSPVAKGVAQYIQIANLNIEPQQRLFDAIV
jgi:hypothetical protein